MQVPPRDRIELGVAASERHPATAMLSLATTRVQGGAFDERVLLERLMGDRELARVVIQTFLEDIPIRLNSMTELCRREDRAGLLLQVHTIKGSAANVGGVPLSLLARELEADLSEGSLDPIAARLPSLWRGFDELRVEMLAVLRRYASDTT